VFTTILIFAVGFPIVRRRVPEGAAAPSTVPLPASATRPELGGADGAGEISPGGATARIGETEQS
jgi:hypothetical protein